MTPLTTGLPSVYARNLDLVRKQNRARLALATR